jgi:hypothetical protein
VRNKFRNVTPLDAMSLLGPPSDRGGTEVTRPVKGGVAMVFNNNLPDLSVETIAVAAESTSATCGSILCVL